jgi:signal transduction histidine kinase
VSCLAVISTIYWGIYALFPSLPLNSLDIWVERALLASLVVVQWYRYQRLSNLEQRRQTNWVVLGACGSALLVLAQQLYTWLAEPSMMRLPRNELVLQTLFFVALLFIPLSLGIAILRSRLWNIDLIIHRTLVYGVLSACVVGLYVLVVGGLGTWLQTQKNALVSLLAIGLIATLVQPLRWRLQQAVNYLVYGRRYDPYHVLTRLRQRLEATLAPGEVLPVIVETVAAAFKSPYTAIRLQQEEPSALSTAYGVPPPEETLLHLPLSYQGEEQGELVLAQDSTGQPFSQHDTLLLEDLAHHASIAVHSLRLNADIQHSRERLVIAREEERRRLRRNLHDGLGPQLASLLLQLTTVRKLLRRDPQVAEDLLTRAMTHMQEAISDIRRLVYDLRPPALDDLGLLAALREHMQRYDACGIIFTLTAPECLPALPAAVEVACYRIAQEALTNVITHAQARHCHLSLRIGADLELEVSDDGRGLPATQKPGVGLTTMHERARELGGTCSITTQPQGGTRVHVRLPLEEPMKKATQA